MFLDRHALLADAAADVDAGADAGASLLASHNLTALRALAGAHDLEAPDWRVPQWGSAALLQIAYPSSDQLRRQQQQQTTAFSATVPLHLRYLPPSSSSSTGGSSTGGDGGIAHVHVAPPAVFWACPPSSVDVDNDMAINPFDRVALGYDALFSEQTVYHHLEPLPALPPSGPSAGGSDSADLTLSLHVPVLDLHSWDARWISGGTAAAVALGFAWVCWALVRPARAPGKERKVGVKEA